jgi:pimeloyl-ACP methyl ester carboxylesterase
MSSVIALGHRIEFEVRGDEGAPSIVLLHGLAGDRAILVESCEPALARRALRRLYLDLPGHGRSTGSAASASADDLVAALAELVEDVCAAPPLVLGYSYGGYLAQGLARDVKLAGLCLVCPVVEADMGKRARAPRRVAARDEALPFTDDPHERDTFEEVAVVQTGAVLDAYRRAVVPASHATDRDFVAAVRARYAMARPYMDALAGFAPPAAIACGRDDHWVGFEDALRLARALRDCSYHVLARAGHLLPLEAPAQLQAVLDEWLDRCLPRTPD